MTAAHILCALSLMYEHLNGYAGIAESVASSALGQALNKQDDVLGPWVPGRDPLEDALAAYAGMLPALFLCGLIFPALGVWVMAMQPKSGNWKVQSCS